MCGDMEMECCGIMTVVKVMNGRMVIKISKEIVVLFIICFLYQKISQFMMSITRGDTSQICLLCNIIYYSGRLDIMILDEIPKNGKIQKGQYLSLRFFENQISKNLGFVKLRIRDIIRYESQRKGRRPALLSEEEYLDQYFRAHSMNSQYSVDLHQDEDEKTEQPKTTEKTLQIINRQFLQKYPLFYEPKWKIFFNERPSLRTLSMLNHLAYGYFYQQNEEGQLVALLQEIEEEISLFELRGEVKVMIGTGKFMSRNEKETHQFQYLDYIELYLEGEKNLLNNEKDPRKYFDKKQLKKKNFNQKMVELTLDKIKYKLSATPEICVCPSYQNLKVDSNIVEEYLFELRRYFWSECVTADENEIQSIQNRNNRDKEDLEREQFMLRNIISFENSSKLVPLLQKIPNFAYHLSNQEKQVIETKGNMIIIGRSGTGKTTCALLRLFSLETLFKVKSVTQRKFSSKDLDAHSEMRNIFLTASPFLIQELKKSYVDHQINLKFQLQKKEFGVIVKIDPAAGEKKRTNNLDEIRLAEENIALLNKKSLSLNFLKPIDFPGFFTVKNFLIMLDGIYNQNFFLRGTGKEFYNNQRVKNFKNQMNLDFMEKQRFWIKNQKGMYEESTEVDYEYFFDNFWKAQIQKRKDLKCNLNPMTVWAEIFSTIQGSTQSHKCPKFYIGEERYIQISKNRFLTPQEKRQVFFIFKLYKNWKLKLNKFDQTDLVNHLLRKILRNSYLGPTINFLFIDEVQDLTPATIYLVSIITTNNVFYAGDTAQSISKGVLFKFSDIKLMFKNEVSAETIEKQEPEIKQLTVNFRSHNSILKIANCLIKIIQIIFPKTIDSLRKQTSTTKGPKPILIEGHQEVIKLLNLEIVKKDYNFTSRQAIIVRNEEKKIEAKKFFPGALVLTITECKGLQYEDVVLWDLLQEQKNDNLWKILQAISINEFEKKKEQQQILQEGAVYDEIQDTLSGTVKLKQYNINDYHELCSEIKLLYTAITRSKQILIIYRSIPQKLLKLLKTLELVIPCSRRIIEEVQNYKLEKKEKLDGKVEEKQVQFLQWKKAGLEFFKKQNYEQALVCFQNIGDKNACKQIRAKIELKKADKLIEKLRIKKMFSSQQNFKEIEAQISEALRQAALSYEEIKRYQIAGKLFYRASDYQSAIKCFRKENMFSELAQCYVEIKQFMKAAEMYEKISHYKEMVKCLVDDRRFVLALIKMIQHSNQFQDYDERKEEFKAEIFKEIQENVHEMLQKPSQSPGKVEQINTTAFFISNPEIIKQIAKLKKQRQQELPHEKFVKNGKILKKLEKIKNFPIQELRIALEFDKQSLRLSIQSYLNNPFSVRDLVNTLEKLGLVELCVIIGGMYQYYEKIQDYFAVSLIENYYLSLENQLQFSVQDQINQINFEELYAIQHNQNSRVVNDLVKNLLYLGFYPDCAVFFQKKSKFYCKFLAQDKFLKEMNSKQVIVNGKNGQKNNNISKIQKSSEKQTEQNNEIQEIKQLAFMKIKNWEQSLEESEIMYSLQALFQMYDFNQEAVGRAINKINSFRAEHQSKSEWLQNKYDEKKRLYDRAEQDIQSFEDQIRNKKEQLKKLKKQDNYDFYQLQSLYRGKQKQFDQVKKIKIKQGLKKLQNQINQDRADQKHEKPENVIDKVAQDQENGLKKVVMNKYMINKIKNTIGELYDKKNQRQHLIKGRQKDLDSLESQIQVQKKLKAQINEIQYELSSRDNFIVIDKILKSKQKSKNQLELLWKKIEKQLSSLKSLGEIKIKDISKFLSLFYESQYDQEKLLSILNFDTKEQNYLVICEVVTLTISLLLNHPNSVNMVQNYRILKLKEREKGFLDKSDKQTIKQRKQKVNQFFAKIIYIIKNMPFSKFSSVILKFFNCVLFDENDGFGFLKGFSLIKPGNFKRAQFRDIQNFSNFHKFDRNGEFLIGRTEHIIELIMKFIKNRFSEIFGGDLVAVQKKFKQKTSNLKQEMEISYQTPKLEEQFRKATSSKQQNSETDQKSKQQQKQEYEQEQEQEEVQEQQKKQNQNQQQGEQERKERQLKQNRSKRRRQRRQLRRQQKCDKISSNQLGQKNEQGTEKQQLQKIQEQEKESQKLNDQLQIKNEEKQQKIIEQIEKQIQKLRNEKQKQENERQEKERQEKEKASKERLKLQEQYAPSKQKCDIEIEQNQNSFQQLQSKRMQIIQSIFGADFKSQKNRQLTIFNLLQKLRQTEKSIQKSRKQRQNLQYKKKLLEIKLETDIKIQQMKAKQLQEAKRRQQEEGLEQCSICLQRQFMNLLLECKHSFHLKCIMDFLKSGINQKCPICRDLIMRQKLVTGVCEHCNIEKVQFKLRQYVQEKSQHLYCENCIRIIEENSKIGNNLYSYFSKRRQHRSILMKKLRI